MRLVLIALSFVVISHASASAQSGRRVKESKPPPPTVEQPKEPLPPPPVKAELSSPVTAEKNEEYMCTDDGTLARVLDSENSEQIFSAKAVDTRVVITSKPKPAYTKEARRLGIQGFVVLRVALSANGSVGRIRVVKRLPAGLTENAIRAVCKIEFKPATKASQPVSQWVDVEYVFRLADSSIFRP